MMERIEFAGKNEEIYKYLKTIKHENTNNSITMKTKLHWLHYLSTMVWLPSQMNKTCVGYWKDWASNLRLHSTELFQIKCVCNTTSTTLKRGVITHQETYVNNEVFGNMLYHFLPDLCFVVNFLKNFNDKSKASYWKISKQV